MIIDGSSKSQHGSSIEREFDERVWLALKHDNMNRFYNKHNRGLATIAHHGYRCGLISANRQPMTSMDRPRSANKRVTETKGQSRSGSNKQSQASNATQSSHALQLSSVVIRRAVKLVRRG